MESIQTVIQSVLAHTDSRESLAQKLGVSVKTLKRWEAKQSAPRPLQEGILRDLYEQANMSLSIDELNDVRIRLQERIDQTLSELREVLHRRAQFSSRNEGLEEMSKLFFAHITSVIDGENGISTATLTSFEGNIAQQLKEFVRTQIEKRVLNSDVNGMTQESFQLKLKDSEIIFAGEIVSTFEANCALSDTAFVQYLKGTDILNNIFGKFLADSFFDEKQLGQYLTPQEVVAFVVKLIHIDAEDLTQPTGYILDPSCGVGSFLAEYLEMAYKDTELSKGAVAAKDSVDKLMNDHIVGVDKSERMVKLATINLSMFGYGRAMIKLADSLSRNAEKIHELAFLDGSVELIMTNPPFGIEFSGSELLPFDVALNLGQSQAPKINSEVLYFDQYIKWLKPGGRLVCVVPDSILNNRGIYEHLREYLRDKIDMRAVISLPTNTFASAGTNTKTSILYLQKKDTTEDGCCPTYMAVCKDIGYDVITKGTQKCKQANGRSELQAILDDYQKHTEIKGRWVRNLTSEERWDAVYHALMPADFERDLFDPENHYILLRDVAKLSQEKANPKRWGQKQFHYIEIADVNSSDLSAAAKILDCSEAPSRARKVVHTNDIIVSTVRPERGVVAVIRDEQDGYICTTGFAVLTPTKIDALTLAALLKTEFVVTQINRYATGVSYPTIEESALMNVVLPISYADCDKLSALTQKIRDVEKQLRAYRDEFNQAVGSFASANN